MGKTILFSPIGGTDPISNTNGHDGSMLHICRNYKPDTIYLYFSKEMYEREQSQGINAFCLKKLYEAFDAQYKCIHINKTNLIGVQDFDFFYDDFVSELDKIRAGMNEDDRLLINISSGSPAMKSALLLLTQTGRIDAVNIQVLTPEGHSNVHDNSNYDVERLWNDNPDNAVDAPNRCKEIVCPSLLALQNEKLIANLVRAYDYEAALQATQFMPSRYSEDYYHLLEYAQSRLLLEEDECERISTEYDLPAFVSVEDRKQRVVLEYALAVIIRYKNGDYAGFIRSITPLILELYALIILKVLKVNVYDYCYVKGGHRWSIPLMEKNNVTRDWIKALNNYYQPKRFGGGYLKSDHLICIINEYIGNPSIREKANLLRDIEEGIRNGAAHEITSVTEQRIYTNTGFSCEQIIEAIKGLYSYINPNVSDSDWNSYEIMNDLIVSKIERK